MRRVRDLANGDVVVPLNELDRKVLADLAVTDKAAFAAIVGRVRAAQA